MLDLASWKDLVVEMRCWESSASDFGACIVLTSPQEARSLYSARDDDCPVALKLLALHNAGWEGASKTVVHKSIVEKFMDHRRAVSKGKYLNCLLALKDALVHNNSIRSDQPQSYYALVLSGTTVKAGLGDKEYRRISSGGPLGIEGPPRALALKNGSSSDEFDAPGSRAPKRPRAAARAKMEPLLALPDAEYASPPPSPSSPRTASSPSVSVGGGVSDVESYDGVGRSNISGWVEMERGPRFKADAYKPRGKTGT